MNVLLVSAGLADGRTGGSPSYINQVVAELSGRGHHLHYLDTTGRSACRKGVHYETTTRSDGLVVTRFFNLNVLADYGRGTMHPLAQTTSDPAFFKPFEQWSAAVDVDIVHVHELIGFPVDAMSCFFRRGIPVMATMHDFYALCPTVMLMLPGGHPCNLKTSELVCRRCCRQGVSMAEFRLANWMQRIRGYRGGSWLAGAVWPKILPMLRTVRWWGTSAKAYRMRRENMLSVLRKLDLVCGNSKLTSDIYRRIGGLENVATDTTFTSRTVRHEASVRPARAPGRPLRVLVLNVRRPHKGLDLLRRELARLGSAAGQRLRFVAWGCSPIESPLLEDRGPYEGRQLDVICSEADLGLVPSVCMETYGFVGAEMLSRGLPLIASRMGAMKEYIAEGQDGLLFDPLTPGDLARVLNRLVEDDTMQNRLLRVATDAWKKFSTFEQHIDQLVLHYEQLVQSHARQSNG